MHTINRLEEQTKTWNMIHTLYDKILECAPHCSREISQRVLDSTRNFDSIISQFEPEKDCFSSILQGNSAYILVLKQLVVREIIEYPRAKELHQTLALFLCLTEQQIVLLQASERSSQ